MTQTGKLYFYPHKLLLIAIGLLACAYSSTCVYLYFHQRQLILRPTSEISNIPSSSKFNISYQNVKIPFAGSAEQLSGWWIPAPSPQEKLNSLPNEPIRILKSPKTIMYLYGAGGNKSYYNYLTRVEGLRNMGFSVMVVDYRGFGESQGNEPNESQMYEDSQTVWDYLIKERKIDPKDIIIYGESLGGAIAIDLAVKHPEAKALIVQSSFTSMSQTVKRRDWLWMFPVDLLLTQKFDSISKIHSLKIPVLFIHGTADSVVPSYMSQKLYDKAPEPKEILLVPGAEHFRIYQPGQNSYLQAINKFMENIVAE
jgi:uncharacterized protein